MQLTQKETSLLKDLKGQEKLCIDKYNKSAQAAVDPQLKGLFSQLASVEQGHYNMLGQIEKGATVQPIAGGSAKQQFTDKYGVSDSPDKQNDCYLCTDLLTTEKHASSLYDTCVFEFRDDNVRKVLASIQQQEQEHGKMIYDYMSKNSMYS